MWLVLARQVAGALFPFRRANSTIRGFSFPLAIGTLSNVHEVPGKFYRAGSFSMSLGTGSRDA